ncbi:hypothetical protein HanXRQr2_Chr15g0701981 [Helianthus annuus]|uniref:Uncharacterized protein n=1 Tax=Helianthus annuus TaxID=4232 RepID=A0A9K3E1H3_HELAN|nr:hypothetical protein HanXRQr2_Chr15g0701981 [Helianthus annuus]KAJ0831986.1 hypothetical protein HanPSC8_Chr15g0673501 [Helianthus annuus]
MAVEESHQQPVEDIDSVNIEVKQASLQLTYKLRNFVKLKNGEL